MNNNENKPPVMDAQEAKAMLDKIFEQCEVDPNSVPIEALAAYTDYQRKKQRRKKLIPVGVALVLLLVVSLLMPPRYTVEETTDGTYGLPVYLVHMKSLLPVRSVGARMGDRGVPVSEVDGKTFSVEPSRNGTMEITVTLFNRRSGTTTVEVNGVDNEAPVYTGSKVKEGKVSIFVRDDGTGVDFEGIYAMSESGDYIEPLGSEPEGGEVIFEYPEELWDIYIPDKLGNTLHLAAHFE